MSNIAKKKISHQHYPKFNLSKAITSMLNYGTNIFSRSCHLINILITADKESNMRHGLYDSLNDIRTNTT